MHCSGVSTDEFEELNADWENTNQTDINLRDTKFRQNTLNAISSLEHQVYKSFVIFSALLVFQGVTHLVRT